MPPVIVHPRYYVPTAYPKDPDAEVWYGLEVGSHAPGSSLVEVVWSVSGGDGALALIDQQDGVAVDGYETVNRVMLSGGTPHQTYRLTCAATFNHNRYLHLSFNLPVWHL
ncbi:hypothetical protein QWY84_05535 [Aquisalimonas lutea]|uniref:phage fiber-tail adaptor protein n=1 Tax=Aquisalimonas lutea TaxID=1327750 RepID=UPI0025B507AF|nr:hypothetical protein [Aquisalimonas lutea]MDN3517066.1 hypothetical protein [Aquisalimonas lutea]